MRLPCDGARPSAHRHEVVHAPLQLLSLAGGAANKKRQEEKHHDPDESVRDTINQRSRNIHKHGNQQPAQRQQNGKCVSKTRAVEPSGERDRDDKKDGKEQERPCEEIEQQNSNPDGQISWGARKSGNGEERETAGG